jgi:hypothetical protein
MAGGPGHKGETSARPLRFEAHEPPAPVERIRVPARWFTGGGRGRPGPGRVTRWGPRDRAGNGVDSRRATCG